MNSPYHSPTASLEPQHHPRARLGLVALGVGLAALPALTCWFVLAKFADTFEAFGVQLPVFTRLLLSYHGFLWLVPVSIAALAVFWPRSVGGMRAVALGLASAMILVPVFVIALYLPIFKLGAVVG